MSVNIVVPPLGESVPDATVSRWLKEPGDPVRAGEPVLELETDKVNLEVAAERDGTLGPWLCQPGDTVHPGEVVGTIEEATGAGAASAPPVPSRPEPAPTASATSAPSEEPRATPAVRRLADATGVDLHHVQGSGHQGRILRRDVLRAAEGQTAAAPAPAPSPPVSPPLAPPSPPPAAAVPATAAPAAGERAERVRLSRRRLTIARRLVEAQHEAAMLTTFNEIDMSRLMDLRRRHQEAFQARHHVKLGFMSLFTRATVAALKQFPYLNAELDGDELVLKHYYHIGIAVASEGGLVVPVIRDADRKTLADIEREIIRLRERVEQGTLTLSDLEGGTFTITNGGVFGSLFSTPILNKPQVGILGMHAVRERPVAVDGDVVIRPMMYVALSYDHRVIDGSEAVRFLVAVKEMIEDPERLLLDS
jgi:2-oxoglutarate dehydrogenase E2 component (dihydrolipoamide succinyltransferase)